MSRATIGVVGLIGGMLALLGIFTPWITLSAGGYSLSMSAWDSITESGILSGQCGLMGREVYCTVALAGVGFALLGALGSLVTPKFNAAWALLAIGGLVVIFGAAWAFSDIETGSVPGISIDYGWGLYLCLVGGIVSLIGVLGLGRSGNV